MMAVYRLPDALLEKLRTEQTGPFRTALARAAEAVPGLNADTDTDSYRVWLYWSEDVTPQGHAFTGYWASSDLHWEKYSPWQDSGDVPGYVRVDHIDGAPGIRVPLLDLELPAVPVGEADTHAAMVIDAIRAHYAGRGGEAR
jgi:hypothetical protein